MATLSQSNFVSRLARIKWVAKNRIRAILEQCPKYKQCFIKEKKLSFSKPKNSNLAKIVVLKYKSQNSTEVPTNKRVCLDL